MFYEGKLNEGILFAFRPVAEEILHQHENGFRTDISSNHDRRVVRNIITALDEPHHCSRSATHCLLITAGVLSAWILVEKPVVHFQCQKPKRVRLVTVKFANDNFSLLCKLTFVEQRIA